ncbi:MAG: DUF5916 domain-containing protein, partial [Gemmatimonadota bacterium]|nr:DUF5916 domain-containing protein [Gemmatimonadota bacterium]
SVGLLEAVTAREEAIFVDRSAVEHRAAVEPLSNYFVGRVKRDLRSGQTVLGAMVTSTHRALSDAALAGRLRSAAYAGGVDFKHEWANRAWSAVGFVSSSSILGEPQAITAAQRSSARYYDRPDAEHLTLDPTATSLGGYNARLDVGKRAGLHWTGNVALTATSPGYEINDLGFQTLADRRGISGSLNYAEYQPGSVFQQWNVNGSLGSRWNYGNDFLGSTASVGASGLLLNYWGGGFSLYHSFAGLDDRLTWGGPLARGLAETGFDASVYSDSREAWTGSGSTSFARDQAGGWRAFLGTDFGWRAASNWNVSVGPYLSRYHSEVQFLAAIADPTAVSTYGNRYVFSDVSQTSVGLNTRLNVTFTPNLALSVYAQPFVSSSGFGLPKELSAPRTLEFGRYGTDVGSLEYDAETRSYRVDPDGGGPAAPFEIYNGNFNTRSLRGNAVLRWEYRPGSTLFLVWQQNRFDYLDAFGANPGSSSVGRFNLARDTRRLFGAAPDNIFMLKVNYWLNP